MVDEASMSLDHVSVLHTLARRRLSSRSWGLNPARSTYEPPLFSTERRNA
jgi:hypothetical protein